VSFHILSFEGPDPYARVGGLATRVDGLVDALASLGFPTHLWFVGDPSLPGHELRGNVILHRWCQWISALHRSSVYDGEWGKAADFAGSLPPFLVDQMLRPQFEISAQERAVVIAEEWQTVGAVLHLDERLRHTGLRSRVRLLWNANNTFGFEHIPWERLARAATITTVSRYMKQLMRERGIDAVVIPNGLPPEAFEPPNRARVAQLRRRVRGRTLLAKMARWDPDKRWMQAVEIVTAMKVRGWRPLLLARGGSEPYGEEVLSAARARGLNVVDAWMETDGVDFLSALQDVAAIDVVNLKSHVDAESRRVLLRASDAVLANSRHEPFGLVGLETMAAGGVACIGSSGEDYAVAGQNALILESDDPEEFLSLFDQLRAHPRQMRALRRAGRDTARRFAWPAIIERVLLPRLNIARPPLPRESGVPRGASLPTAPGAAILGARA